MRELQTNSQPVGSLPASAPESWFSLVLDPDLRIRSGGEELARLAGEAPDFLDFFPPEEAGRIRAAAAGGSSPFSLTATAGKVPVELMFVPRADGYELFFRDIRPRIGLADRLAVFYRHFRTSPIAICLAGPDGLIVEANRAFLDLYGYTAEEVVGRNPNILKSGRQSPTAYREMWERITDPETGSWSGELINRRKDGEEVTVHITVSAVRDPSGEVIGFIANSIDITRSKRMEEDLHARNMELLELSALKSELMAITSHDLKSPLYSMVSRARMVRELFEEMSREKVGEQLEQIIAAGTRMSEFITDILDLEKIESGVVQLHTGRLHLDGLLRSCIEMQRGLADEKKVTVGLEVRPPSLPLIAEATKVEQVAGNLLGNALKFSPPGGAILITCWHEPEWAVFTVADQGTGIPDGDLDAIFDRYYQVRKKGSVPKRGFGVGLGLHITKKFLELHGGEIAVENLPERGCRFTVRLPLRRASRGREMAALIHDPDQLFFAPVEAALRSREIACFITSGEQEARRVLEYEKPEIVFLPLERLTAEFREFVREIPADGIWQPHLVGVQAEEDEPPPPFRQIVTLPVAEMEIHEILKELRIRNED